jgi:hypothetical protein
MMINEVLENFVVSQEHNAFALGKLSCKAWVPKNAGAALIAGY